MIKDKKGNEVAGTSPLDEEEFIYNEDTQTVNNLFKSNLIIQNFTKDHNNQDIKFSIASGEFDYQFRRVDIPMYKDNYKLRQIGIKIINLNDKSEHWEESHYYTTILSIIGNELIPTTTAYSNINTGDIDNVPASLLKNGEAPLRVIVGYYYFLDRIRLSVHMKRTTVGTSKAYNAWVNTDYQITGYFLLER